MIAVWMLYCLGIGLAFVLVGHALERGLHLAGGPTRWAWVIALLGSYLTPIIAWLRPDAVATLPVPAAPAVTSSSATATVATIFNAPIAPPFSLADLDAPLRWAWLLVSCGLIIAFVGASARLVLMRRRWRRSVVDGRDVLISADVGPAVVGLWSPRVVLPAWTLALDPPERELMLSHEEQHLRAKDPALLAAALAAVLLAPWNLALWWQWRRLRLAVEMDCDARVLREGGSPPLYGELLLRVGERRTAALLGIAAFGEPVSFLESRIQRMCRRLPRWRWAGVAGSAIIAAGVMVAACEAPRPFVPQALAQEPARTPAPQAAWVRDNVRRFFAKLDDPTGPALDAFLIHDGTLRVYQGTLRERGLDAITTRDLKQVFPSYDREHDAWGVVERPMLQGIVRDNVRVIWLHHDPQPQDTMPSLEDRLETLQAQVLMEQQPYAVRLGPDEMSTLETDSGITLQLNEELEQARWAQRDNALRKHAQQAEPAAFAGAHDAIALVIDSDSRLVAHTAGTREPGDRSCSDVLTRLLPAYRSTRFPVSGCLSTEKQGRVVVYWGQLEN